jgi:hypothetical protein
MTIRAETSEVLDRIHLERERQDRIWGGPEHDDKHNNAQWYNTVLSELGEAAREFMAEDDEAAEEELIHTAAVIAAWVESRVRQRRSTFRKVFPASQGFVEEG